LAFHWHVEKNKFQQKLFLIHSDRNINIMVIIYVYQIERHELSQRPDALEYLQCSIMEILIFSYHVKFNWHFTDTWKTLAWRHRCTKSGGLDPWNYIFTYDTVYVYGCSKPGKLAVMHICAVGIDFSNGSLELFRQCGIFCFTGLNRISCWSDITFKHPFYG
jgi:hypothetical protein